MYALAYSHASDILPTEITLGSLEPTGHDLRVAIKSIAVNPVDTKINASLTEQLSTPRIVGWDAASIVEAVGEKVSLFKPGDKVFYAGDISRAGCYASHQIIDERIVGRHPRILSFNDASSLPLTSITAWEALFSRLKIRKEDAGKHILIIGGAGGVGSIAIQLAKSVANLNVIATASKPQSQQWCKDLGADHIIDHHDLLAQYQQSKHPAPDYIFCLNDVDQYFTEMAELIAPQGMICGIAGTIEGFNFDSLKSKSVGFVWEFMFTRPMHNTPDLIEQHHLLNKISELIDNKVIRHTRKEPVEKFSAENIQHAHTQLLTGNTIGKIVLSLAE